MFSGNTTAKPTVLKPTCFHDMPNGGTAKRNRAKSGKASDLRGGGEKDFIGKGGVGTRTDEEVEALLSTFIPPDTHKPLKDVLNLSDSSDFKPVKTRSSITSLTGDGVKSYENIDDRRLDGPKNEKAFKRLLPAGSSMTKTDESKYGRSYDVELPNGTKHKVRAVFAKHGGATWKLESTIDTGLIASRPGYLDNVRTELRIRRDSALL